jgi:hypothetical protein
MPSADVSRFLIEAKTKSILNWMHFRAGESRARIKRQKELVRHLVEITQKHIQENNPPQRNCYHTAAIVAALEVAAREGSYETAKTLLTIPKLDIEPVRQLASQHGRQRIMHAIAFYQQQHQMNTADAAYPAIDLVAKFGEINRNHNSLEGEFTSLLKQAGELSNQEMSAILVERRKTLRKKHRGEHIRAALFGAICPAITVAELVGSFAPLLGPLGAGLMIGAVVIVPVLLAWNTFSRYKAVSTRYSQLQTETYYRTWLAAKFDLLYTQLAKISADLDAGGFIDDEVTLLEARFRKVTKQLDDCVTLNNQNNKKALHYYGTLQASMLPENERQHIKRLAAHDPVDNADLAGGMGRFKAAGNYATQVLCSAGAGLTFGTMITGLIFGKVGIGFLGAGVMSLFAGPIGPVIVAVALTLVIGVALYKATYQQDKKDIGEKNREYIHAHDEFSRQCKRLKEKHQAVGSQLALKLAQDKAAAARSLEVPEQEVGVHVDHGLPNRYLARFGVLSSVLPTTARSLEVPEQESGVYVDSGLPNRYSARFGVLSS